MNSNLKLVILFCLFLLSSCGGSSTVTAPWIGTKQLGVAGGVVDTTGNAVATDASGNVYIVGYTTGGLDGNTLTGTTDFFITKYNSSGIKQYTNQMGFAGAYTEGRSIAIDTSGNVYIAGYTEGGLDGNKLTGIQDFFVTKYNSSGVKQYTNQMGVIRKGTQGQSITTDDSGNVYVAGTTSGGLDDNTLTGTTDFFITKYNSSGVKQYTRQLGVARALTYGQSVATDTSGNVYVTGTTYGGLDGNTQAGFSDAYITKFNSSGDKLLTYQMGVVGLFSTFSQHVAIDASGDIYISGSTNAGLDGNFLTGTYDAFMTKFDNSLTKQYTKQMDVAGKTTNGASVATDASGNVFVAGYTYGGLDSNTLTGTTDSFVTKYDSSGAKQFTKQLGVAGAYTQGSSIAIDASGNVFVAGFTGGGLDGNTLAGTYDSFVTKYSNSGVKQ
jgi:hypothetical protein